MAEEQIAFDNWEEEAELQLTKQPAVQPPKQEGKVQNAAQDINQEVKQQKKAEPVNLQKLFNQKLASFRQIDESKFQDYLQNVKEQSNNEKIVISNQILKNDKDFAQFAKKVGKKLNDILTESQLENLQDEHIYTLFEEITLLVYNQVHWKNIEATKEKLRIVKKEKKDEEVKLKKQKREEKMKKQGKGVKQEQAQSPNKQMKEEDDIFGGATLVNSKQIEEEIKAKGMQKLEAKKVEEDDDDFM